MLISFVDFGGNIMTICERLFEMLGEFLGCSPEYLLTGDDPSKDTRGDVCGISDEGLEIGALWDQLDKPGQAIILGKIYERLEGSGDADHADGRGLKRA